MMSIGAALNAATTLVGTSLPAGLIGERTPVGTIHTAETEEGPAASPTEGALLIAIEAGLREAGYLSS
jgi:hypothetical protein